MKDRIFVAMSSHYWGKGPSVEEAIKQCRKAGGKGRRGKDISVFLLPEGATNAYVDMMGSIHWQGQTKSGIVNVS